MLMLIRGMKKKDINMIMKKETVIFYSYGYNETQPFVVHTHTHTRARAHARMHI